MSILMIVLPPIHLLAYSTLLGTQLYQSFVIVKVAYQALPYDAFTTLQKRLFPVYFRSQTMLVLLTAATFPTQGPLSLIKQKSDWIPFVVASVTAGLNLIYYGPKTIRIMMVKKYQADIDGKKMVEGFVSDEMMKLKKAFSRTHAMSIHLNLIAMGATLWYGWRLASRLEFNV